MNESTIGRDQTEDDILTSEFADDEMEVAAGTEGDPEMSFTQTAVYGTWSSTCSCGC
jgi:hypothetical protein